MVLGIWILNYSTIKQIPVIWNSEVIRYSDPHCIALFKSLVRDWFPKVKYSNHLNTGPVWYSNGWFVFGRWNGPVFQWSAKSCDFTIWIPDTHTVRYSDVRYSDVRYSDVRYSDVTVIFTHLLFFQHESFSSHLSVSRFSYLLVHCSFYPPLSTCGPQPQKSSWC